MLGDEAGQVSGGDGGIRTLDRLPYTRFPSVRDRPLCHVSANAARTVNLVEYRTAPLP